MIVRASLLSVRLPGQSNYYPAAGTQPRYFPVPPRGKDSVLSGAAKYPASFRGEFYNPARPRVLYPEKISRPYPTVIIHALKRYAPPVWAVTKFIPDGRFAVEGIVKLFYGNCL